MSIAGTRTKGGDASPVEVDDETVFPLFPTQRARCSRVQPSGNRETIQTVLRLREVLDRPALERALTELVARHPSLRTRLLLEEGRPRQWAPVAEVVVLPVVDLRPRPVNLREAEAGRLIDKEAEHRFDLARGPVLRALSITVADDHHLLAVTVPKLNFDEDSRAILAVDLDSLYRAGARGAAPPLPFMLPHAALAHRQQDEAGGGRFAELLDHWRANLAGAPALLSLPTDRPRPAVNSFASARRTFRLSSSLSSALAAFAEREGATLFTVMLAGFKVLLARASGQFDVLVGTRWSGRDQPGTERLIGPFADLLVLRTPVEPQSGFGRLVARVREVVRAAEAHRHLPFELLLDEVHPVRPQSHHPLLQVAFSLAQRAEPAEGEAGPRWEPVTVSQPARFDLDLQIRQGGTDLEGLFEYNTGLFDAETVDRMAGHLVVLLEGALAEPQRPIAELPILTEAEREKMLVVWNGTAAEVPQDRGLPALFAQQAAQRPEAVAVVFEKDSLSYAQLDRRSNQLARHLRGLGVGPDVLVGICIERSLDMIVGVLAILKAGGAYLPLDPAQPPDRLGFMLDDARAPVLLTREALAAAVTRPRSRMVLLDTQRLDFASQSEEPLAPAGSVDDLVAAFYSSGSTGRPKGSLSHARGFLNLFEWYCRQAEIDDSASVLVMTPFTFDASFKNLICPLLRGGRLVLAAAEFDIDSLLRCIEENAVTTTFATPGLLYALTEASRRVDYAPLRSLRTLFVGGEATDLARLRPWLRHPNRKCRLIHIYGPSECSDISTFYEPTREECLRATSFPIGRPIPNTQAYVLDKQLAPVPIGVAGELCVSGIHVGRGYLNQDALNAERFLAHPFRPGERLYRTGDRVRFLANGAVEFLGRLDDQVKIRGIRIELAEIETILGGHPLVRQAVVLAREDVPGNKRLVGYVQPAPGQRLSGADLRTYLRERLPEYMVPSTVMIIESFPVSPNGKIDRQALPPPATARSSSVPLVGPRNAVEAVVVQIWQEALGLDAVSVDDDFLDLGGHSLLAVEIATRLRDAFQIELPLRRLIELPTPARLATEIAERERSQEAAKRSGSSELGP
jgi:amino acid adenylation domain-containing protein